MKSTKLIIVLLSISALFTFSFTLVDKKFQKQPDVKDIVMTDTDAEWANSQWNGTTLKDLKSGQEIFYSNCHKCHGLKNPYKFAAEKLQRIVGG